MTERWKIVTAMALLTAPLAYYMIKNHRPATASQPAPVAEAHQKPILIAGVNEPEEMRVEPKAVPVITPADRAIGEVLKKFNGKSNPAELPKLMYPIVAAYPNNGNARLLRLSGLCEIPTSADRAILSDIEVAIKNPPEHDATSIGSLLAMRAKLAHDAGNDEKAMDDLEAATDAVGAKASDVFNNGGVKPGERVSSKCMWTEANMNDLVQKFPSDYRSHLFRGLFYTFFATYDEPSVLPAKADLQKAIDLNKNSGRLHYYLASVNLHSHFFKRMGSEAVQKAENPAILRELDQAIELEPKLKPALGDRADVYFQAMRYADAIADYERILAIDPDDTTALHDEALAKLQSGDTYGAISGFSKAIDKIKKKGDDISANAYENLGDAYLKTHQNGEAIAAYTKAIGVQIGSGIYLMSLVQFRRIFPEYASASDEAVVRKIQQTYFPQFEYDEFVKTFNDPGKKPFETFLIKDLYLKRAEAYLLAGKYQAAATDYRRGVNSFESYGDSVERWHTVQTNPEITTLLDLKSADFRRTDAMRTWIKHQRGSEENGAHSVEQYEINCETRQSRTLSSADYNSKGDLIGSRQGSKWDSIIPDTLGEIVFNGMCAAP
jgi:tetratricopeptide (TPR) repeat protein